MHESVGIMFKLIRLYTRNITSHVLEDNGDGTLLLLCLFFLSRMYLSFLRVSFAVFGSK